MNKSDEKRQFTLESHCHCMKQVDLWRRAKEDLRRFFRKYNPSTCYGLSYTYEAEESIRQALCMLCKAFDDAYMDWVDCELKSRKECEDAGITPQEAREYYQNNYKEL